MLDSLSNEQKNDHMKNEHSTILFNLGDEVLWEVENVNIVPSL